MSGMPSAVQMKSAMEAKTTTSEHALNLEARHAAFV